MSTTTINSASDTDTTVQLDIDLEAVPTCQRGDECVGEQGPAVARLRITHRCDHVETVLICSPCLLQAMSNARRPVQLTCPKCDDTHPCLLPIHAEIGRL